MKIPILLVLLLLLLSACSEQSAPEKASDLATETSTAEDASKTAPTASTNTLPDVAADKISEHTYVIHGPIAYPNVENKGFMNNPAFVVTKHSVVVLDPGSSLQAGEMVLRQIKQITDKPITHVFNTHGHGDHWLGNHAIKNAYPEAQIYAHPEMIKRATHGEAESWVTMMELLTEGFTTGTKAVIPDIALADGQEIKVSGMTFRVYLLDQSHSESDAMIEVVEDSLIVMGDSGLYKRIARMDDGSFRGNIAALELAVGLNLQHYIPGHGHSGGVEAAQEFLDYLKIVYAAAEEAVEEGLEAFEIKEALMPKVANYHDWKGFEDEFGKHLSLAILEAEAASFE